MKIEIEKVKIVGFRALLKPIDIDTTTASGIIIPSVVKGATKYKMAEVIKLGKDYTDKFPDEAKVGDKVLYFGSMVDSFEVPDDSGTNHEYIVADVKRDIHIIL